MNQVKDDLELAIEIAMQASQIAYTHFHAQDFQVRTKPDLTPVSDADLAAEKRARQILSLKRPSDGVIGEEFAEKTAESNRTWVIDPIDGTKNFVRLNPVWATLVALIEDDQVVCSAVVAPALARTWWAAIGSGAYSSFQDEAPRRLRVSEVSDLADASLSFSSLSGWREIGCQDNFLNLADQVWRLRGFGDFWSHLLVAEGACDLAAEPELNLYDMAALVPIVREAGGQITALDGTPAPFGGNAVSSNGHLHAAALAALNG